MFKSLDFLINLVFTLGIFLLVIIGFKMTLFGQACFLILLTISLWISDRNGRKTGKFLEIIGITILCVGIGNLLYFCYNFIDFNIVNEKITSLFNSKTLFR